MSILNFINTKARALVIFLFSLVSLGVFAISAVGATFGCKEWYGVIAGIALMFIAIPFHCMGKKGKGHQTGYLTSFLINSAANGLSVSAYYLSKDIELKFFEMLLYILPAAAVLLLTYLMLQMFDRTKRVTVTVAVILDLLILIGMVVLWIIYNRVLFSFGFFSTLISLFYLCVFGVSVNHDERAVLRDISFGSFGSFIILTVVVVFILSEGDILSGLDIDDTGKKKKSK